jgi:8-oxo-dGTP pyrophosphatase MutT (NUDIX family)
MVRAAGGIISRRNERGEVEVLLIHRPGHGDWSLPKGSKHTRRPPFWLVPDLIVG